MHPATAQVWAPRLRRLGVRSLRLLLVAVIVWLVRNHHRAMLERGLPVQVAEVASFLPAATRLQPGGPGDSIMVRDRDGVPIGYAATTQPRARGVVGYAGVTDVLVVVDERLRVLGIRVRGSEDTRRYVEEVGSDVRFNASWTGMLAARASRLGLGSGLDAVAGATPTSRAVVQGISRVLADLAAQPKPVTTHHWRWSDAALGLLVTAALVLTFAAPPRRRWWRWGLQGAVGLYVVLVAADFVTLKLLVGWARSGLPWEVAPGLVALIGVAVLVPVASARPVYCLHLCPHGAAQEWLQRLTGWRREPWPVPGRILRVLPWALVALALWSVVAGSGLDLAELEPFDAYNGWRQAVGAVTVTIAVVGLLASAVVPKAYCRFGCPTGALLEYVRGSADGTLGWRDAVLAALAVLVLILPGLITV